MKLLNILKNLFYVGVDYNKRIYGLDFVRTIAIFLVLISHSRILIEAVIGSEVAEYLAIGGFLGVELFFVLSGFLIGTILLKINDKENGMSGKNVFNFWIRRWFRTLPNYYLLLLLNFILILIFSNKFLLGESSYWLYFIFSQNLVQNHPVFFGEAWSLAVEEWFYITLPLLVFFITTVSKRKISSQKIILIAILTLLVSVTCYRIFIALTTEINWDKDIRKIVAIRLDAILYGVIAAYIKFYYQEFWNRFTGKATILGILFLLFTIFNFYGDIFQSKQTSFFSNTFYCTTVNFGLAFFLFPFSKMNKESYNTFDKAVTILSIISYSLYLIHRLCIIGLMKFFDLTNLSESILAYIIFWISVVVISILLFKYFEQPTTKLRDKYGKGKKSVTVVT